MLGCGSVLPDPTWAMCGQWKRAELLGGAPAMPYLPVMAVLHSVADLVVQLLCKCLQGWQPLQAQPALRHRHLHQLRGLCEHCWGWGRVTAMEREGHCVPCQPGIGKGRGHDGTGTHQPGAARRAP